MEIFKSQEFLVWDINFQDSPCFSKKGFIFVLSPSPYKGAFTHFIFQHGSPNICGVGSLGITLYQEVSFSFNHIHITPGALPLLHRELWFCMSTFLNLEIVATKPKFSQNVSKPIVPYEEKIVLHYMFLFEGYICSQYWEFPQ